MENLNKLFGHISKFLILKLYQNCLAVLQEERDWASRTVWPFYTIDLMLMIHLRSIKLTEV